MKSAKLISMKSTLISNCKYIIVHSLCKIPLDQYNKSDDIYQQGLGTYCVGGHQLENNNISVGTDFKRTSSHVLIMFVNVKDGQQSLNIYTTTNKPTNCTGKK